VSLRVDLRAAEVAAPRCYCFCCNSERNAEHGDTRCTESRREEGGVVDEGKGTEGMGRVDRQLDMDFTI